MIEYTVNNMTILGKYDLQGTEKNINVFKTETAVCHPSSYFWQIQIISLNTGQLTFIFSVGG